ncbi:hypothetical protein [Streptomyces fructofermentans]|uniref:hypothetical protein n=1 Tax=Streptomyces fructofermentans TaxID=152141 RepID=UPI0033C887F1
MTGMQKYVAATAVVLALVGAPSAAYAGAPGKTTPVTAQPAAKKAPTARIVAPGEHVVDAGGAHFWLTEEGKHWTTPENPEPQFRSVVDGNIDLGTPGVGVQVEPSDDRVLLSGVYYGGRGTASSVTVRTTAGTLHGRLLELAGDPGWGVWYVSAELPADGDGLSVRSVVVRDTVGRVYSRLDLN